MKRKITMSDVLIESIFDSIEEDERILDDDPRLTNASFRKDVKIVEDSVDRIIGELKVDQGLKFGERIELVLSKFRSLKEDAIEKILNKIDPTIDKQLILQFNRQLKEDCEKKIDEDDLILLKIIENIDDVEDEIERGGI